MISDINTWSKTIIVHKVADINLSPPIIYFWKGLIYNKPNQGLYISIFGPKYITMVHFTLLICLFLCVLISMVRVVNLVGGTRNVGPGVPVPVPVGSNSPVPAGLYLTIK